jgi:hypothetical protein
MTDKTREEHLAWCKEQALEYLDRGYVVSAITSMLSDLDKHPETKLNPTIKTLGLMYARDNDIDGARRFIMGFN